MAQCPQYEIIMSEKQSKASNAPYS